MNRQSNAFNRKRAVNGALSAAEEDEDAAIDAAWAWIDSVREASDTIEALDPIPLDYNADSRWPA